MENRSEQGPKLPVVQIVVLIVLGLCSLTSFAAAALIQTKFDILLMVIGGAAFLGAAGSGAWLFMTLWQHANKPPQIIERERKVVQREVVTHFDQDAHDLDIALEKATERVPIAKKLREELHHEIASKNLPQREESPEHAQASSDETVTEQIADQAWWDKFFEFVLRVLPFLEGIIVAIESKRGNSDGSKGLGCLSRGVFFAVVIIPLCCILSICSLVAIPLFLNSTSGGTSTAEPTLAPIFTPVPGTTSIPQALQQPQATAIIPPTQGVVPTPGASAGQIAQATWTVTCNPSDKWCFGGYATEGNTHLFPWLKNEINANCSTPVNDQTWETWRQQQWETAGGHFNTLREWYHQGYNSSVNLATEATGICAVFGGSPK